jgi:hypothetical protein
VDEIEAKKQEEEKEKEASEKNNEILKKFDSGLGLL